MRTPGRWLIVAVISGALLSALPILALHRALDSYVDRQARGRLEALAHSSLGLVETRLEQVATTLVDLASEPVDNCGPNVLEALRLAVFTTVSLKGLAVLAEDGRTLCTSIGMILQPQAASREYNVSGQRLFLAMTRFRDLNDRSLHLRLERADGRSLVAIIAADALLPDAGIYDGEGRRRVRLLLDSGDIIATQPAGDGGFGLEEGHSLTARRHSLRYPLAVTAERSRRMIAEEYHDLLLMGRFGSLLLVTFGIGLIWMYLRRNHSDPLSDLKRAIKNEEIVPYFQPTVDLTTGRVRGAEVLARWRHPDGTIVSPAHFIPLAEQSGLIYELTSSLMRQARDEVGSIYVNRPQLRLGFNMFAGHMEAERVVDDIKQIFGGSKIAFDQVVLEVTERTPLADLTEARRVISILQKLGVRIAIDDVGTGHGGLSYLLKLGVNVIKIDKMFVDALSTERYSHSIIESLVELARTMDIDVVAEGLETLEQVEFIRSKGIVLGQGYVFAPPLPASSYITLVEAMERPRSGEESQPQTNAKEAA